MANINTYVTLTLNVAHCKFINNTSLLGNTNDDANGGAIALLSLTEVYIRECIFLNNTSPWLEGAIYDDITDVFRYGQFDNNRTLSIVSCNFINNTATYYRGAMELNGYKHFTLYNSTFVGNKAMEGGAIDLTPLGEGYIMNCNVSQYFAERGGAIGISSSKLFILNCIFVGNQGNGNQSCGGPFVSKNPVILQLTSTTFIKNKAFYGGAMCLRSQAKLVDTKTYSNRKLHILGE